MDEEAAAAAFSTERLVFYSNGWLANRYGDKNWRWRWSQEEQELQYTDVRVSNSNWYGIYYRDHRDKQALNEVYCRYLAGLVVGEASGNSS